MNELERPMRVTLEITGRQVRALLAAANGETLTLPEKTALLDMAMPMRNQMRSMQRKVASLMGDMGANNLLEAK